MAIIAVRFKYNNKIYPNKFEENTTVREALTECLKAAGEKDTDPDDRKYTIFYRTKNQINKGHVLNKTLKEAKIISGQGMIIATKIDDLLLGK